MANRPSSKGNGRPLPADAFTPRQLRCFEPKKAAERFADLGPSVILAIGGPGAGVNAHCDRISRQFGWTHLNAADLIRKAGCGPGEATAEVVLNLLKTAMEKAGWVDGRYIVSGFPQTFGEFQQYRQVMESAQPRAIPKFCLYFDTAATHPAQVKLSGRGVPPPPVSEEAQIAHENGVLPLIEHFRYEGLLQRIDVVRDVEKVWRDVQHMFLQVKIEDENTGEAPEEGPSWAPQGSPMKAIWQLRARQSEELLPHTNGHLSECIAKDGDSRQFNSHVLMSQYRTRHTRSSNNPRDQFVEPASMAQDIGWKEGVPTATASTGTPRYFTPRVQCHMTKHMDNMFSTSAQNIIRRW